MPYTEAKVEVILLVLGLPTMAIISLFIILSIHWLGRAGVASHPLPPKWVIVLVPGTICCDLGNLWLNRKFADYRRDPTASLNFDTERDRRIAKLQKGVVFVVCGLVTPLLAVALIWISGTT